MKESTELAFMEKIKILVENVNDTQAEFYDDPNGPYSRTCPHCGADEFYGGGKDVIEPTMATLNHAEDCAWVLSWSVLEELEEKYSSLYI